MRRDLLDTEVKKVPRVSIPVTIKELGLVVLDPRRFARQRTVRVRKILGALMKAIHFRTYLLRRRLTDDVDDVLERPVIPSTDGFVLWHPSAFPLLDAAIDEANRVFDSVDLHALTQSMPTAAPFTRVPFDLTSNSAIARLAVHPILIKTFADYLGVVPVLQTVQLMYSPNHRLVPGSSQYYHLDGQDVRSLQVFVYLHDVTLDHGPLTLIPANISERIAIRLRYRKAGPMRRLDDRTVSALIDSGEDVRVLTGPKGSILVFDGDRCLHYGSRPAPLPRRILHYAYFSPFAFTLPARWWTRYEHLVPSDAPRWQRAVVARV